MARTEINCLCTLFYFPPTITSRGSPESLGSPAEPCKTSGMCSEGFPHRANFSLQGEEETAAEVKAKPFSRVSALLWHPHSLWDTATPNTPQGPSWHQALGHRRGEEASQNFLTMPRLPEPITTLDSQLGHNKAPAAAERKEMAK